MADVDSAESRVVPMAGPIEKMPNFVLAFGLVAGALVMCTAYVLGLPTSPLFVVLFLAILAIAPPAYAVSPLTMIYFYYGLWFVIAPSISNSYAGRTLDLEEYRLAFCFAFCTFATAVLAARLGTQSGLRHRRSHEARTLYNAPQTAPRLAQISLPTVIVLVAVASTVFVYLIVAASGGLERWMSAPGDAFLGRQGSGVFVVASHFSSQVLAALVGYYAYTRRVVWPLAAFIAWLALTSPVHGSKMQISLLLLLMLLPWLRAMPLVSFGAAAVFAGVTASILIGFQLRGFDFSDSSRLVGYFVYFSALENLATSLRDFDPDFLLTFFLPFNKLLTPVGLSDPKLYFDMNHLLTDIYLPHNWAMRATEQWPVETDLYLNFYFFGGLPLVFGYFFLCGWIEGVSRRDQCLGAYFVVIMTTVQILSHLRGSLYNHIDFYMVPYLIISYFLLRKLRFPDTVAPGSRPT
jgi:hypothetical protein